MGEVVTFFQSAGWGQLMIEKETKNEMELTLTGEMINRRLDLYSRQSLPTRSWISSRAMCYSKKILQ